MLHHDDQLEICRILALVGHLADEGHVDRFGEVFTTDVVYDLSSVGVGTVEGIDAVRRAAQGMAQAGGGPLAHHVTNVVIADGEDDGTASAVSKTLMLMRSGALESVAQHDTFRIEGGEWRISHRVVSPLPVLAQEAAR